MQVDYSRTKISFNTKTADTKMKINLPDIKTVFRHSFDTPSVSPLPPFSYGVLKKKIQVRPRPRFLKPCTRIVLENWKLLIWKAFLLNWLHCVSEFIFFLTKKNPDIFFILFTVRPLLSRLILESCAWFMFINNKRENPMQSSEQLKQSVYFLL